MTEETAIEVWRELAPLEASVVRETRQGANDPVFYCVQLPAMRLSGKQLSGVMQIVSERGLDLSIDIYGGHPIIELKALEALPLHPASPKE